MNQYEADDSVIRIRPVRVTDAETVYLAIRESILELSTWMVWAHPGYSMQDTLEFVHGAEEAWAKDTEFSFAIVDHWSGKFLGTVGLNNINRQYQMCNLGYWVRTAETGRGLGARGTHLAARFGLRELGLNRIEIVAAVDNIASQKTAEKAGAHREGVLRHRIISQGEPKDAVMFSLITGDFTD